MRAALPVAAALLLAACGREAPREEAPPAPDPVVAPDASAGRSVAYTCERDLPITAIYGTDAAGEPDVALLIQGQDFRLQETEAASGARYASDEGISPGMGLIWWEKDGTAMLQQAPSDKVRDPAAGQTIRTCREKR